MSFYNPYSKYPDFGGGMQDWASMLMQMWMINKMFPGAKTTEEMIPTDVPPSRGQTDPLTGRGQDITSQAQATLGTHYFETPEQKEEREKRDADEQMRKLMQALGMIKRGRY